MKNAFLVMSLLLAGAVLLSCSRGDAGVDSTDFDKDHSHSAEAESQEDLHGLTLNQGVRWQMDEHTRASLAKMAASFSDVNPSVLSQPELKKVGADLDQELQELIQGCTMVGEAHDQLHTYLTGYIPAVASLSESGQRVDADRVGYYLEIYNQYFE